MRDEVLDCYYATYALSKLEGGQSFPEAMKLVPLVPMPRRKWRL
ncbi:MAG: hypothetical protein AAF514_17575 [Verrucomicrobiota bacterium]